LEDIFLSDILLRQETRKKEKKNKQIQWDDAASSQFQAFGFFAVTAFAAFSRLLS
jgi:hypothetical protein